MNMSGDMIEQRERKSMGILRNVEMVGSKLIYG